MNKKGNPQNLRPIPNELINRKGRPKMDKTFTQTLKEIGGLLDIKKDGEYIAKKEALGYKLWELALDGDLNAIRYIYDRIDGTPVQMLNMELTEKRPIVMEQELIVADYETT